MPLFNMSPRQTAGSVMAMTAAAFLLVCYRLCSGQPTSQAAVTVDVMKAAGDEAAAKAKAKPKAKAGDEAVAEAEAVAVLPPGKIPVRVSFTSARSAFEVRYWNKRLRAPDTKRGVYTSRHYSAAISIEVLPANGRALIVQPRRSLLSETIDTKYSLDRKKQWDRLLGLKPVEVVCTFERDDGYLYICAEQLRAVVENACREADFILDDRLDVRLSQQFEFLTVEAAPKCMTEPKGP